MIQNRISMCNACEFDPLEELTCPQQLPGSLRRIHLFEDLEDDALAAIAAGLATIELPDGRWLYRQGEDAKRFYFVQRGRIALFRQSLGGRESIVAIVGENELFADELVFAEEPRYDLHARAVGTTQLVSFESSAMRRLVLGSTALCLRLLETQNRRQGVLLDHIERLTLFDATQRVLAYLLDQVEADPRAVSRAQPVRLSVPKSTLASHLAIQPETLSRAFAKLRECNYLREEGSALVLDAPDDLLAGLACSRCSLSSWGCPGPNRLRPVSLDQEGAHGRVTANA